MSFKKYPWILFPTVVLLWSVRCTEIRYSNPVDIEGENKQWLLENQWALRDTNRNGVSDFFDFQRDTTVPVVTVLEGDTVYIKKNDPSGMLQHYLEAWTATDPDGTEPYKHTRHAVDVYTVGEYIITYVASDTSENSDSARRVVIIYRPAEVDTVPPILTIGDTAIYLTQGEEYAEPGATAFDLHDGKLTDSIVITGTVDVNTPGTYVLTYSVSDSAGNSASGTRTVVVAGSIYVDNKNPFITLLGEDTIVLEPDVEIEDFIVSWVEPGYTAYDSVAGGVVDLTDSVVTSEITKLTIRYWVKTYDVRDSSGNAAMTAKRYFDTGIDVLPIPVIDLNYPDSIIELIIGRPWEEPGYTASDTKDGDITELVEVDSSDLIDHIDSIGKWEVVYEVTNSSDQTARVIRQVKVVKDPFDTEPPVITIIGKNPDTVLVRSATSYDDSGATAFDEYENKEVPVTTTGEVDFGRLGEYSISYSARDSAGNNAYASRTVWVVRDTGSTDLRIRYAVPAPDPLPDMISMKFTKVEVDGTGPNLDSVNVLSISWQASLQTPTLHDLSISFNGEPYNIGRSELVGSHTFGRAEPTLTIPRNEKTGGVGLDGTYYVTYMNGEFIWVHEDLEFAVIWME